jgi:BlaI family penicillinase repressor
METPMSDIDDLGDLQRDVMEHLWKRGEGTVQQVRAALGHRGELAYTTVLATLQKLEMKGWLTHRAQGRTYVYAPARSRRSAGGSSVRSFVQRVFNGDRVALIQHLMDDRALSAKELAELQKLIDAKKKETGRAHDL